MTRILARVLAIVVVGVAFTAWRMSGDRNTFGLSDAAPLGTFDKLNAYLTGEMHLSRSEGLSPGVSTEPFKAIDKIWTYDDPVNGTPSTPQRINLILDRDGKVTGIAVLTNAGALEGPVPKFMIDHWRRSLGMSPASSEMKQGNATNESARAGGHWVGESGASWAVLYVK